VSVDWNLLNHETTLRPFFFFFLMILGFELRAYTLSHFTSTFCVGFFKIGSRELFAWVVFEPQSSCSLPPE
jgi:hypothetical protein